MLRMSTSLSSPQFWSFAFLEIPLCLLALMNHGLDRHWGGNDYFVEKNVRSKQPALCYNDMISHREGVQKQPVTQVFDALTNLCVERLFRRLSRSLMFFLIDCCVFDVVVVVSYLTKGVDKILIDGYIINMVNFCFTAAKMYSDLVFTSQ